jgi:hypothetical protein
MQLSSKHTDNHQGGTLWLIDSNLQYTATIVGFFGGSSTLQIVEHQQRSAKVVAKVSSVQPIGVFEVIVFDGLF